MSTDAAKEKFLTQVKTNLENNGFPAKKVSFDVEKMYEIADNKGFSFNSILDDLKAFDIEHEITTDKVIFSAKQNINSDELDSDKVKEAQKMFENMSQEEKDNMMKMFQNMSEEDKEKMMEQAKGMGLF